MIDIQSSIQVEGVSKQFRIYPTAVERFKDALGWRADFKQFLALSDVSFNVRAGEFWGILGSNGSGKSTLLKIISGQLQPTSGSVACRGHVALLQLGLGFDPELTGLDNVRHSRLLQNLTSDYEEIVDFVREFSELGDFINYPVKTYSSGMYSRLAFATAIAGDPDILIADEVLAVGDLSFSQKCLAKMREFRERGKTVILVTHDINAVKNFCDHAVWLNEGRVAACGVAKFVADDFRNFMLYGSASSLNSQELPDVVDRVGTARSAALSANGWTEPKSERRTISSEDVELVRYRFVGAETGLSITTLQPQKSVALQINLRCRDDTEIHSFGVTLHDRNGLIALHLNSEFFGGEPVNGSAGQEMTAQFLFDVPPLANGDYSVSLGYSDRSGKLIEKYDYDSAIEVCHLRSAATDRQGGYVVIPSARFELEHDA